jgi:UDP:flavonoid glycosyltransferase YjiC (YdhE family)
VRVLFSTTGGVGHFGPLVPIARECAAAGHEIAVAAPQAFHGTVENGGFPHLPFPDVPADVMRQVFDRVPHLPFTEANRVVVAEVFARLDAQAALPELIDIIASWQPDMVVREPYEFASLVAADSAGIAQVQVAIGMNRFGSGFAAVVAEPLAELSTLAGLPPDRGATLAVISPTFTSVPAVLDAPDLDLRDAPPTGPDAELGPIWRFRVPVDQGKGRLPGQWGNVDDPLVYVTYGSVTGGMAHLSGLYAATLDALADLPVRVLLTTGRGADRSLVQPSPPNAWVEQWWPQAEVMPLAAAMIGHGGFGTTMAALVAGVPQVVVPLFAFDQFVNAEQVAKAMAGVHLIGGQGGLAELPRAVTRVLHDPDIVAGARAVAADIAAQPELAHCVQILEELAGYHRP